jgi:hypothetical protein
VRQYAATSNTRSGLVERPLPARPTVSDRITITLGDQPDQSAELDGPQPREREGPLRASRTDHLHPDMIHHGPATELRDVLEGLCSGYSMPLSSRFASWPFAVVIL